MRYRNIPVPPIRRFVHATFRTTDLSCCSHESGQEFNQMMILLGENCGALKVFDSALILGHLLPKMRQIFHA
jgi:hypothetical protein